MTNADILIHSASQLVTAPDATLRRGTAMRELTVLTDGALAIADGRIVAVDTSVALRAQFQAAQELDASGMTVLPGFVDPHTHAVYAGDRVDEFERRLAGESYQAIMAAGGGIASTVRQTQAATLPELLSQTERRLATLLALGTTTAEVKSGYGLSTVHELRLLEAVETLAQRTPLTLVPTFLGAHAVPPEFRDDRAAYVELVITEMLPQVAAWYRSSWFARTRPGAQLFIDVFCEQGAFSVPETERILAAGVAHGMRPKAHVDQFTSLGGVAAALRHGAVSLDHLEVTAGADLARIAASDAVAVLIPAANVNLGLAHHAPARALVEAGAAVALCTDLNPGSAPCYSMPLVMALACRFMRLLPAEALNAATINAAHALALGGEIGSLAPGKCADVIIADVRDYRHLLYYMGSNPVRRVICGGQVVL